VNVRTEAEDIGEGIADFEESAYAVVKCRVPALAIAP
jgi:hypothetical protein